MIILGTLLVILLILMAAFYSGTETAMTSASRTWIADKAKKGDGSARIALTFLEDGEKLLGTVLIGNNITHVCLTTLTRLIIGVIIYKVASISPEETSWDEWLTSAILTPVVLIFGEVIPKALGRSKANTLTLLAARPLYLTEIILKPAVLLMGWLTRVLSPKKQENDELNAAKHSAREDMKIIAEMAAEQGLVNRQAGEMLQSVLELESRPVETAMVPLIEVRSLPETASVFDALALSAESGFMHIPVYRDRVDRIIGIVNCRDLLMYQNANEYEISFVKQPIAPMINRKVIFVPESQPVNITLETLRQSSTHVAIVVDEYGGVSGMITIEDLAELIVGNLNDERATEELYAIQRIADNAFLCSGRMEVRELEEYLGIDIPNTGFETAAGLVMKLAGRIPEPGEKLHYRQFEITVLQVEEHRIAKLKFQKEANGRNSSSATATVSSQGATE